MFISLIKLNLFSNEKDDVSEIEFSFSLKSKLFFNFLKSLILLLCELLLLLVRVLEKLLKQ